MIVDLERHAVVDLLPDREATSVAGWLRAHPSIEVVARDRAEVFAEGARTGAPQAQQVLDRFHLLRNFSVALHAIVAHHHATVRAGGCALVAQEAEAAQMAARATRTPTAIERRKRATHAPQQARNAELKRLVEAGASVAGIARALGLNRQTVRGSQRQDAPLSWQRRRAVPTIHDPYRDQLTARWQAGCHNAAEFARGLIRAGVDIRPGALRNWAMKQRRESTDVQDALPGSAKTARWQPPSINRTTWLLQREPSSLGDADRRFLERLRAEAPVLTQCVALAASLADLVRRRSSESLEAWFTAAAATPLAKFAAGLERDAEALRDRDTMVHRPSRGADRPPDNDQAHDVRPRQLRAFTTARAAPP